ncbi:low choriolytic enzyme-like isoform X2 [Pleuronectes platessa]|uniref:low choriolytic enzyme-like isoform X2 n=1 Tax=Pleuronectes platessa TaxID=8262 RepID=UPI00232A70EC|nr:low choriolytic enzyme-like isoform X2 [Pleuronectes platessa]
MDFKTSISLLLLLLLGCCKAHDENDLGADNVDMSDTEDITATILRMNNGSTDFLMEGDVMIPRTRNAMKCYSKKYSCLWPKSTNGNVVIPFLISGKYYGSEKREILNALQDFERRTCIRFVTRTRQRAYLSFEPRNGCASLLGTVGDKQVVSLQRSGCIQRGIIQHEVLHALGFYHEHTRSDRDQYVKINWENIDKYNFINFRKMDTDNLNTPYDYTSVMHYGRTAFGRRAETITPIPNRSVAIGQRSGMSRIDILRINRLYRC